MPGRHVGVRSVGGALSACSRVGLRRPPLGAGRAHWRASGSPPVVVPRTLAAPGAGDAGSPVKSLGVVFFRSGGDGGQGGAAAGAVVGLEHVGQVSQ